MKLKNKKLNISIIFYDSPIARSYINYLLINNYIVDEVIILTDKKYRFLPKNIAFKINYFSQIFYALNLLKSNLFLKNNLKITNYFNLENYFIFKMYSKIIFKKLSEKIYFIRSNDINSNELYNLISNKNKTYLYTGGGILKKKILNSKNKFLHIHPGYLPEVRGADGVLWSILKFNFFGVSSFYMNDRIDEGAVIYREKLKLSNFSLSLSKKKIDNKVYYRFIYSFIDPLLRTHHLRNIIKNGYLENSVEYASDNPKLGAYYSFMNKDDLENVIKKLFNE
jgi:hypothetical protein